MIVHLLRFGFRSDATREAKAGALTALRRMAAAEAVAFAVVGQDLGGEVYTHSYLVGIAGREAFERYLYAPGHRGVIEQFAAPLAVLTAVDLADDLDPGLGDWLRTTHQRWLDREPAIADLLAAIPAS